MTQDRAQQNRQALLIATSKYRDPSLSRLRAPGHDVKDLANVLSNPLIGGFDVQTLIDSPRATLLEEIEGFCADRRLDDQLLIYLSCHGVLDDRGRLYYAATDTRRDRLAATAIEAGWLNDRFEDSRARSQIVILDCCHSGAFARGAKGAPDLDLEHRFKPRGHGRVVLTASKATEYSFEGNQATGPEIRSVFTRAIVDGLRTGDADLDQDGAITASEAYQFTYEKVRALESRQTPGIWVYGAEGDVILAWSIRGAIVKPIPLAEDLRLAYESPRPRIRESAVAELADLLDASSLGISLSSRQILERIESQDIPQVASLARVALKASPGRAGREVANERTKRDQQSSVDHRAVARNFSPQVGRVNTGKLELPSYGAARSPSARRSIGNSANPIIRTVDKASLGAKRRLGQIGAADSSERIMAVVSYLIFLFGILTMFRRNYFTRVNAIQSLLVNILFLVPVVTIGPANSTSKSNGTVATVPQPWLGILDAIGVIGLILWVALLIYCISKVVQGKIPVIFLITRLVVRISGLQEEREVLGRSGDLSSSPETRVLVRGTLRRSFDGVRGGVRTSAHRPSCGLVVDG